MWAVVADDNLEMRQAVEAVLANAGFLVIACRDADELLVAARRIKPALIVTALDGPRSMDGMKACLRLAAEELAPAVVFLSGDPRRVRSLVLRSEWQVLSKPFRPETLLGLALQAASSAQG